MSSYPEVPREAFRLRMLIFDTRYRSLTIQIVTLAGFLLLVSWMISNTVQNLAELGKPIRFDFLWNQAQYDINQTLIAYSSRDTHLRAAIVGLLNTLLVAFLGCALATAMGVVIGVLRLSRNWLVARLMTVYVEIFRNVPVLLWILFFMAILIESLPPPNAFRGADATASMLLGDSVALTNRGFYIPEPLFSRSLGDLSVFGAFGISLDLLAVLAVLAAGLWVSARIRARAERIQNRTGLRPATWYLRLGVIVLPLSVLLAGLGFHLGYPELRGFNFRGGIYMRNSLIALWLALSFYTAAFIAEIVRGGILAISKGQTEAAAALGLRPNRIMSLVILPQALRVIIPPLISQYLNLTKNSSLAIAVGYMDITGTLGGITMGQTGRELECVLLMMGFYLAISLAISTAMNWYDARVRLVER
ncbi:amino acid ABC transporter permease [Rhodovulum sp. MB263]|uniref:amino acid ABC transporter permease n=1 Tax=Rhodovulum sp. (strain MB263) TaxID=308754 RepID=UPI0009B72B6F|nr:ABC transporter permease subunit [Rhodovulum sp. MB263]ARC90011.1 amino acid ABC transporter permease [Rhodovulum sp. MB263]